MPKLLWPCRDATFTVLSLFCFLPFYPSLARKYFVVRMCAVKCQYSYGSHLMKFALSQCIYSLGGGGGCGQRALCICACFCYVFAIVLLFIHLLNRI